MVGEHGVAKVLDFGLARRVTSLQGSQDMKTATLSAATEGWIQAGTPGYMSPEQIVGASQDSSTDVFSFGCLLYECLSGARAIRGTGTPELLAATLRDEPDWSALPVATPRGIRTLLKSCLQRDAGHRVGMAEARRQIDATLRRLESRGKASAEMAQVPDGGMRHNLPHEVTTFVGREREIAQGIEILEVARLVTLIGIGGGGKTRLALKIAADWLIGASGEAWFVELASILESARVPAALADTLGVRESPGMPLIETLVQALQQSRALLILDNCEHVAAGCAFLAERLIRDTPVRILATSRNALEVPGERLYMVPPLSLPAPGVTIATAELASYEALELFVERARRADAGLVVDGKTLPVIAEICRHLDGIPLAIELAAARVRVLSVNEIRDRLGERFRLLTSQEGAVPARHRRLESVIAWSYEHLDENERRLIRALSVFSSGATLQAIAAACLNHADEFDTLGLLDRLVERSMVVVERIEEGASRYRMLETVRDFANRQLLLAGEESAARDRHLDYYLSLIEESFPHLSGSQESEWVARIAREHANILAALSWCDRAPGGAETSLRLVKMLGRFWYVRGDLVLGGQEAARALARPGASAATAARAGALYTAGDLAVFRGELDLARHSFEDAIQVNHAIGDTAGVFRNLFGLANVDTESGDNESARTRLEQCLAIAKQGGPRRWKALTLGNLAEVCARMGDLDASRSYNEEALELLRAGEDQHGLAMTTVNQAHVMLRLGSCADARRLLLEGLRAFQGLGAKRGAIYGMQIAAALAITLDEPDKAARYLGIAEMLRQSTGSKSSPTDLTIIEASASKARRQLGEESFKSELALGRASEFESAMREVTAWLE
jgi:non-specific serine/threonine protein kinase